MPSLDNGLDEPCHVRGLNDRGVGLLRTLVNGLRVTFCQRFVSAAAKMLIGALLRHWPKEA